MAKIVDRHLGDHRQVATRGIVTGHHRLAQFVEIAERFEDQQIHAALEQRVDLLTEGLASFGKGRGAERFNPDIERSYGAGDESVLDSLPRRDAIDGQMASEANAETSHALADQSIPGNHDGDAALASALDSENVPYIAVPRADRGASDRANSEAAGSEDFAGERGADERTSAHSHADSSSHSDEQRDDDERAAQAHKAVAGE